MAPSLSAVAREHPQVMLVEVDVEARPEVASEFGVRAVPTLVGLIGGAEQIRSVGDRPASTVSGLFEALETGQVRSSRVGAPGPLLATRAIVGGVLAGSGVVLDAIVLLLLGAGILLWALIGLLPRIRR